MIHSHQNDHPHSIEQNAERMIQQLADQKIRIVVVPEVKLQLTDGADQTK